MPNLRKSPGGKLAKTCSSGPSGGRIREATTAFLTAKTKGLNTWIDGSKTFFKENLKMGKKEALHVLLNDT